MVKLKTGRHTSALKALRQSRKHEIVNKAIKRNLKSLVKDIEQLVVKKDLPAAKTLLNTIFSKIDKSVKKNILHKNTAARQKSQLSKLVNSQDKTKQAS